MFYRGFTRSAGAETRIIYMLYYIMKSSPPPHEFHNPHENRKRFNVQSHNLITSGRQSLGNRGGGPDRILIQYIIF